jgi:hypothetical protein
VPIGITNRQTLVKPIPSFVEADDSGRNECELAGTQPTFSVAHICRDEIGLPLEQVTGFGIGGIQASITRCDVFEELHARTRTSTQGGDSQASSKDVVQVLLFDAIVFAFSNLF